METRSHSKALFATYLMTLLYALHYGIPMYATSTFLRMSFSSPVVSLLFVIASTLTLLASLHITKYVRKFHTYWFTLGILIAECMVTALLAFTVTPLLIALFFVIHFTLTALIYVSLNTFVETFTPHEKIGSVRGIFLTILNTGILVSPFLAGPLLELYGFKALYLTASISLVPFIVLLRTHMRRIPDPHYSNVELFTALKRGWRNIDIRIAIITMFLLESFYAVMVIYSPLYLISLGIPLSVYLSAILPVALIPLVALPYELGILADTKFGEKELLITGLLIMSITTMIAALTTSSSIFVWITILILSRIGAACVETMTFSYYFKKINPKDIGLITLFSNLRTVANIAVPTVGIIISPLVIRYPSLIFVLISLALLMGAIKAYPLHDTK